MNPYHRRVRALLMAVGLVSMLAVATPAAAVVNRPVQVAGFNTHCALLSAGTVECWGFNEHGQVGDGTRIERHHPVPVRNLSGVTQVSAASGFFGGTSCALLRDATVRCWGSNGTEGALGIGSTVRDSPLPVRVKYLVGVTQISVGENFACAVLGNGSVKCWGYNGYGQLGTGDTHNRLMPTTVAGLPHAVAVSAGYDNTCALTSTGAVYCWGYNQLGENGTHGYHITPTPISGGYTFKALRDGWSSCGITTDDVAMCWGPRTGDGTDTIRWSPVPVHRISGVKAMSHDCVINGDGTDWCWGYNVDGQLGQGTVSPPILVPVPVRDLGPVSAIGYSCAITVNAILKCWGDNQYGQVGDRTTTNRTLPVRIYL